jgi:hypothetical protein
MKMFKCLLSKIQKLINSIKVTLHQLMILFHQVSEMFKINKTYMFKILISLQISFKEIKKAKRQWICMFCVEKEQLTLRQDRNHSIFEDGPLISARPN